MLFLDQKAQCPWVSLFLRHAPSFPAFPPSLISLPQVPRTERSGAQWTFPMDGGSFPGWRSCGPQLEELWPPPPRLPGCCSSLKDVGNEVRAAGSTDEVAFLSVLSSDKRPGAAHACQPPRLIRLFMASQAEPRGQQAGGRAAGSGVPGGYIQALVLTASGS